MQPIIKHLLNILLISGVFCSCSPRTQCIDFVYYDFRFTRGTATDSIPDTTYIVTNYTKGSNFSLPLNSDTLRVYNGLFKGIMTTSIQPKLFSFAANNDGYVTLFDWKYVFLPSGNSYFMKNIQANSRSERQAKYMDHECFNDLTFMVNDSSYTYPGDNYSTAFPFIKY